MQVVFNSQERTLRELVTLSASAGWKVTKVSRTTGSLFGYLVAVPVGIPEKITQGSWSEIKERPKSSAEAISIACKASIDTSEDACIQEQGERKYRSDLEVIERASSRCGTPTFGSNMRLSSVQEALARFGGGIIRKSKGMTKTLSTPTYFMQKESPPVPLKPALTLFSSGANSRKKTKPSPLSIVPVRAGPSSPGTSSLHTPSSATIPPSSARRPSLTTPTPEPSGSPPSGGHTHSNPYSQQGQPIAQSPAPKKSIPRRLSLANLRPTPSQSRPPPPPLPTFTLTRQPPVSPNASASPSVPVPKSLPRRLSHAHLSHAAAAAAAAHVQSQLQASQAHGQGQGLLAPSFIPIRASSIESESGGISSLGRSGSNLSGSTGLLAPMTPQRSMPRKSSYAQLPLPSLRTRSGTVTGGLSVVDPSNSHSLSPSQNLVWGSSRKHDFSTSSPGASVSKSKSCGPSPARTHNNTESLGIHSTPTHGSGYYVPEFGSGVLAAAARIERGEFGSETGGDDTMI